MGALLIVLIGATSLLSAMPATAITPSILIRDGKYVEQVMPQGWAFFTKSMNAPDVSAYAGDLSTSLTIPASDSRNLLGVSRLQRAQGPELAALLRDVLDSSWKACNRYQADITNCAATASDPISTVSDGFPHPSLCGRTALVKSSPVPWAWAAQQGRGRRILSVATLDVVC